MKELFKIEDKTKTKIKWWNCDNCGSEYVFELPFSELIKFCGYLQEEASK